MRWEPESAAESDRHEIVVVRHGTRASARSELYLHYEDYGSADAPLRIDYYLWVVRSPARTTLVDLGFDASEAARRGREAVCRPVEVWRGLGIEPDTFDGDIVLTHGHWDHTGHIDLFPRARFVLARAEYDFWMGPASRPRLLRQLAREHDLAALARAAADGRVALVDGVHDLAPGIRLVPGPGHTPGLLMVEVATRSGPVLLASDAAHFDEEVEADMPFRYMVDLVESFATFAAIRDRDDDAIVVAGHEPGILDRFPRLDGPLGEHASLIGGPAPGS